MLILSKLNILALSNNFFVKNSFEISNIYFFEGIFSVGVYEFKVMSWQAD